MSFGVAVDRWDLLELEDAFSVPAFVRQRQVMSETLAPWGADALDHMFLLLFKARPAVVPFAEVAGSHRVGHVLISLLALNPTVQRVRQSTMRDVVAAAEAAAKMAPQLTATAQRVEKQTGLSDVAQADALDLQDLERAVEEDLADLETVAEQAAEDSERLSGMSQTWGLATGELQRLPIAERLALAQQLDTPRAREITDLFGRLRDSMFADRAEIDGFGVEPVDVEVGGDLSRMVGAELLSMLQDDLFYARLGDGALRQYAMHGVDEVGRGGIVLCVDCSGSMTYPHQGYTRELWATALKLHLLHTAMRKSRPLHLINFSSSVSYHRFVDPEERVPLRVLDTASEWYGFGTRFAAPLLKTLAVLADEDDDECDVVFVSDGECSLSGRTRQTYQRATRARGVRTWGVQLGAQPGGLTDFCDHIFKISDLTSGRELGDLLNAVESTTTHP
jgi:uncharacterized protein with von Willebrand factor type A (vWA) domain